MHLVCYCVNYVFVSNFCILDYNNLPLEGENGFVIEGGFGVAILANGIHGPNRSYQ